MTAPAHAAKFYGLLIALALFAVTKTGAQAPYYYGTYQPQGSAPDNSAPAAQPAQPAPEPPPVVYRRARVYRPVYRTPDETFPNDAALGPWPWNFDFGGGLAVVPNDSSPLTDGTHFQFGGGFNLSPRTGVVFEFLNAWLGVADRTLQDNNATGGSGSVWSFTVNPVYRFQLTGPIGGYVIGGGGIYQRTLRLTEPVEVFVPTFNGGFFATGLQTVRQIDDAGGVNLGAGLTWNMGWGTKFFMEARYHYLFTPGAGTQLIPITFGLRW